MPLESSLALSQKSTKKSPRQSVSYYSTEGRGNIRLQRQYICDIFMFVSVLNQNWDLDLSNLWHAERSNMRTESMFIHTTSWANLITKHEARMLKILWDLWRILWLLTHMGGRDQGLGGKSFCSTWHKLLKGSEGGTVCYLDGRAIKYEIRHQDKCRLRTISYRKCNWK